MGHSRYHVNVLIDLAKAFDTVKQRTLLQNMDFHYIYSYSLGLFKNYLSDRQCFVKIGSSCSFLKQIECGVPHESILGPLLFLIYTNDIMS